MRYLNDGGGVVIEGLDFFSLVSNVPCQDMVSGGLETGGVSYLR